MTDRYGVIYTHKDITLDALQKLLCSELKWAYVSRLDEARMLPCATDLPELWPCGRAFGPKQEVRWQQTGEHYHVDVLTETPNGFSADDGWMRAANMIDGINEREILLWGELGEHSDSPEVWIEMRIPRPLYYPVDDLQRALLRVVVQGYDYTAAHIPVATRWAVLKQDRPTSSCVQEA